MATFENRATLSYNGRTTDSNIVTGEIVEVLSATKTAVRDSYTSGGTVTYVVSIVNSGAADLTGLTLTDDLGAYTFGAGTLVPLTYVDGTVRYYAGGVLQPAPTVTAGDTLTVTGITVPAGSNATLLYEARANGYAPPGVGGTIVNTVTVSGTGVTALTATATVTALSEALLSICKSLSPTTVTESGRLTYTFVIQNTGSAAATADDAIVLTDTFDPILSDLTVTFNGASWAETTNYTYNAATGEFTTVAGQITVPAATFAQNATTGLFATTPGVSTLTITGTI